MRFPSNLCVLKRHRRSALEAKREASNKIKLSSASSSSCDLDGSIEGGQGQGQCRDLPPDPPSSQPVTTTTAPSSPFMSCLAIGYRGSTLISFSTDDAGGDGYCPENGGKTSAPGVSGRRGREPKPLQERDDFLESMQQLQLKEWYWGPLSYEQAASVLKNYDDGSFLVRDSSDRKYLLSLSFKSLGEVYHTRIEHAKGLFSFWSQPDSHGKARICEFIEKSVQNSHDGKFLYFLSPSNHGNPPLPIRLLTPVSRSSSIPSLRHLSRFVIRQHVRRDHIDFLPVPRMVKGYLRQKQFYVELRDKGRWSMEGTASNSSTL